MMAKRTARQAASLRPRLRIVIGDEVALGPGRVDLIELIQRTGSLRAAARQMGVSYMRAWSLLKETNACFREPLVTVSRGGSTGGGAKLTEAGKLAMELYRDMEKVCHSATDASWKKLKSLLAG
jgi:molybdate transport system regulatory protein